MAISISNLKDFAKLIAFLRARAGAEFTIPPELMREALEYVQAFARENGIRVVIAEPDEERIGLFAGGGLLAGAAIGGCFAGFAGVALGAAAGAAVGYLGAHLRITIDKRGNDNTLVFNFS